MFRLLFNIVIRLRLRDISKNWNTKKCTWDLKTGETKNRFPWSFGDNPITTTYGKNKKGFHQQYGRFRAKFRMKEGFCFWLLQIEHGQYLEIDHFETFPNSISLTSWRNRHFNSQRRIPNRTYINPKYTGDIQLMKNTYSRVKIRNKKARDYILSKSHRFEIIWRKWFILWKVDGWPCGIVFRNISRQPMFIVVTGIEKENIEEIQVRL